MSKVALVTGASRGIGRAIALKLAGLGFDIALNYRSSVSSAEEVATAIREMGMRVYLIQADISVAADLKKLIDETVSHYGRLDVLVNNAGITADNLLIRMKTEEWANVIDTNLLGVMTLSDYAITQMNTQESGGKIINISSVVGVHGNAGQANYATAKSGVIAFSKLRARQNMPKVQINCIAPGLVATDMTAKFDLSKLSESALGRPAAPADIAACAGWLASEGSYVTGQVIEVDGGLSLYSDVQAFTS